MARKKSFSISLPGIIFMVVVYNMIFDDDNDKSKVEIVENNTPVIEQPVDDSINDLKEDAKIVIEDAKKAFTQLKEDVIKDLKSKDEDKETSEKEEVKPQDEVVIKKEPDPPTPPEPKPNGMKKL